MRYFKPKSTCFLGPFSKSNGYPVDIKIFVIGVEDQDIESSTFSSRLPCTVYHSFGKVATEVSFETLFSFTSCSKEEALALML